MILVPVSGCEQEAGNEGKALTVYPGPEAKHCSAGNPGDSWGTKAV